jgi:hypothetical protein
MSNGANSTILGGSGADTLMATGTGNTLAAGSGSDTLVGSGTNDFYDFSTSSASATVLNGAPGSLSASNELDFGSGLTDENLWFVQSGNNLEIDLLGTTNTVTIANWYSGAGNQLSEITADGLKLDSQLDSLVSAMASYQSSNPTFNPQTASSMPTDTSLQNAIASAWHS